MALVTFSTIQQREIKLIHDVHDILFRQKKMLEKHILRNPFYNNVSFPLLSFPN